MTKFADLSNDEFDAVHKGYLPSLASSYANIVDNLVCVSWLCDACVVVDLSDSVGSCPGLF